MADAVFKMSYNSGRKSRNIEMIVHVFNHVTAHRSENLKKLAQFFQVVIRFHPGLQKTKSYTCSRGIVVRKVIWNRTEPLFQGFLSFQCVFVLNKYASGVRVTYRRWMVFSINVWFLPGRGKSQWIWRWKGIIWIRGGSRTGGLLLFFIKVLFEPGLRNNYQEKEVVKRKGRCPLLILHSHQLNMFN